MFGSTEADSLEQLPHPLLAAPATLRPAGNEWGQPCPLLCLLRRSIHLARPVFDPAGGERSALSPHLLHAPCRSQRARCWAQHFPWLPQLGRARPPQCSWPPLGFPGLRACLVSRLPAFCLTLPWPSVLRLSLTFCHPDGGQFYWVSFLMESPHSVTLWTVLRASAEPGGPRPQVGRTRLHAS